LVPDLCRPSPRLPYTTWEKFILPDSPEITVHEGGALAQALAEELVRNMDGDLAVGAPATVALGLGLVILGVWEWRGMRRAGSLGG
jgi:hypothetical protein